MTSRTVTARYPGYKGTIAGVQFTAGEATIDDATATGKAVIEFAKRQGWAVSGAIASAVTETVDEGKPVATWTDEELSDYLTEHGVQFPSGASSEDLLAAVLDAFETKAQGGSAANEGAGHTSGTVPPEGAPPVPGEDGDDADKAAQWVTPQIGNALDDIAPTISGQPSASSKVEGATATYTVTASGTPTPTYQWQRQTRGAGAYVDIEGATSASYTTPALTVAENHNDRYRVVVTNSDGSVTSTGVQQAVTAS